MCVYMYIYVIICQYISLLCQLSGPRGNDIPIVTSTPSTQILVFNTILQPKVPGLLGKMANSRTWVGNMQGKTRASCSARKVLHTHTHTQRMGVCQIDTKA